MSCFAYRRPLLERSARRVGPPGKLNFIIIELKGENAIEMLQHNIGKLRQEKVSRALKNLWCINVNEFCNQIYDGKLFCCKIFNERWKFFIIAVLGSLVMYLSLNSINFI